MDSHDIGDHPSRKRILVRNGLVYGVFSRSPRVWPSVEGYAFSRSNDYGDSQVQNLDWPSHVIQSENVPWCAVTDHRVTILVCECMDGWEGRRSGGREGSGAPSPNYTLSYSRRPFTPGAPVFTIGLMDGWHGPRGHRNNTALSKQEMWYRQSWELVGCTSRYAGNHVTTILAGTYRR